MEHPGSCKTCQIHAKPTLPVLEEILQDYVDSISSQRVAELVASDSDIKEVARNLINSVIAAYLLLNSDIDKSLNASTVMDSLQLEDSEDEDDSDNGIKDPVIEGDPATDHVTKVCSRCGQMTAYVIPHIPHTALAECLGSECVSGRLQDKLLERFVLEPLYVEESHHHCHRQDD